ncbi:MAG: hypothetical protein Q4B35_04115 [Slackia sp.]|nr:hypothetical protein [Slackia sp.]
MSMKRSAYKGAVAVSAVALAASLACGGAAAFAALPADGVPTLVYDGQSKTFSYRDAEGGDLFASCKDLMPGDTARQEFAIEAVGVQEPVTVYAGASYDAGQVAGIEDIAVEAVFDGRMQRGTVGDSHGMAQPVRLATLEGDGAVEGSVTIEVPTSLGADTAGDERVLTWTFYAQEEGTPGSTEPDSSSGGTGSQDSQGAPHFDAAAPSDAIAKTSDTAAGALVGALAAALASCVALLAALRGLRRTE